MQLTNDELSVLGLDHLVDVSGDKAAVAFEMLLEEVETEIDSATSAGANAFQSRDMEEVKDCTLRVAELTSFRNRLADIRKEWSSLLGPKESTADPPEGTDGRATRWYSRACSLKTQSAASGRLRKKDGRSRPIGNRNEAGHRSLQPSFSLRSVCVIRTRHASTLANGSFWSRLGRQRPQRQGAGHRQDWAPSRFVNHCREQYADTGTGRACQPQRAIPYRPQDAVDDLRIVLLKASTVD